ncbi:MAG: hydrolase [Ignavibacteriales bacterium CG12_big_fil_rev_8_21_14_0_65_30_8]|nr:MAG: hydrolase [Ignavibacteriales bacterium CG12_big_fil_rev_8_21_14_0_65_30_8]
MNKRNPIILNKKTTALLIIDIQEKILGVMQHPKRVVKNTIKLIEGFKILDLPIFYTEQYPKGLGETEKSIKEALSDLEAVQKLSFSCSGAGDLFKQMKDKGITQIVVAGIESHVCVQQTVLDLLADKFQVNLAVDAVSSRNKIDYKTAIRRMNKHGAEVTTTEAILFELLEVCGTNEFKKISKIIK